MLQDIMNDIPRMLLMLPAILLSLSLHEAAHGYVAYKLGDPTARNLGRLTLNPLKHINLIGFLSMLFFRVGWANPVPINTRYFKKPKRDMAISAAAGPLSNLCLAFIFTVLLKLVMIPAQDMITKAFWNGDIYLDNLFNDPAFFILAILAAILYLGILLNINLMLFNLIPLPPLDGSRIAYIFLPTNFYFKVMKYEKYIAIAFVFLLATTNIITEPLSKMNEYISGFLFDITEMPAGELNYMIWTLFSRFPTFSL